MNRMVKIGDVLVPLIEKEFTEEEQRQVNKAALQDAPDGCYGEGTEDEEENLWKGYLVYFW